MSWLRWWLQELLQFHRPLSERYVVAHPNWSISFWRAFLSLEILWLSECLSWFLKIICRPRLASAVERSPFLLFVLRGRRAYLNIPSCLLADNSIHLACAHSITKEISYFCHMVIILFSYNWKVYRGEGRTKTRCFILLSLFFLSPLHYSYLT